MKRQVGALLTLSLLLEPCLHKRDAWGLFGVGDVVIDPTNLVQTTLTAVNTLKLANDTYQDLLNSTQLVKGQIQQLQNDATNLVRSPFTIAHEVLSLGQSLTSALGGQVPISFETEAVTTFRQLYPKVQHLVTASNALTMRQTWADHQRQALDTSIKTQSVLTAMTQLIAQACRLLNSTHTARGALEIAQVQAMQNGLQHLMTEQQTQMAAAVARQQALKEAQTLAIEEAALVAHQAAHKPFNTTYEPQGRLMDFTQR